MTPMKTLSLMAVLAVVVCASFQTPAPHWLQVDCDNDSAQFSTVQSARDHIRSMLQPLQQSVVVNITGTCTPPPDEPVLHLNSSLDSGSELFSISYTGPATFSGGVPLAKEKWKKTNNSAFPSNFNVYEYDLSPILALLGELGYGEIKSADLGACGHTKLELFAKGQPMVLARTPNVGSLATFNGPWMDWMFVERDAKRVPNSFVVANQTADSFLKTNLVPPNKVWLHGFWKYDWADNYIELTNVSSAIVGKNEKGTRLTYNPDTPPVYGIEPRARFYALNSLSMMDMIGEYYIDEASNILYFFADDNLELLESAVINAASKPLISIGISLKNVHFSSLVLSYARTDGFSLTSPDAVLNHSSIIDVSIMNVGITSLAVRAENTVIDSVMSKYAGCRAISISGGDETTLRMANTVLSNSTASVYSRKTRCYNAGISFSGVGLTVQDNTVHDAPHQGMTGGGNNLMFQRNTFSNLCWEVRDSGAWYIGRSWVHRGIVIQNNIFMNIVHIEPTFLGAGAIQAIYLDDEQSGVQVINNTMMNVDQGILVGGGRDNYVYGNTCRNASGNCIAFDNRGMGWQKEFCHTALVQQLYSVHYTQPPYATEYPQLPGLLQDRPCVPVNNTFAANFACEAPALLDQSDATITSWGSFVYNNTVSAICP